MAQLPDQARVVIIGGGAVGASTLFHLAKAGWTDCVLLEKNELTSGSTWHAAGNVPTFSASWSVMNMQRYSTELYRGLSDEVDYPMNYHVTGSIRLAHSKERMQEFERVNGMGRYQGMDTHMCTNDDLKKYYPFLETHDLEGGMYDPNDGDIDPAQLTQALAKGARDLGAQIIRFCPVTGIDKDGDEWLVQTEQGTIRCEKVVNAAGYRAQEVGRWFIPFGGREVPMMTMSHQYLLTEEIPELQQWSESSKLKLPLLRDVDSSYYLRQEKFGLNLGPYELNCKGHWMTPDDPMPEDFSFQLYPDDLERIEWHIEDAMARVPMLGEVGINKCINGPIPYTPDGNPLIGPMPGVRNAYEACVFTFGIAQSGGAGKVMAEWITEGSTEWDMWSCDPRRFTGYADQDYCNVKGMEVYGHEYAMHFPHHEWPDGRNKKLSPLHDKMASMGAQFGAYNGWERPNWFAKDGDDTSEEATQTWNREGPWYPRIREECHAVRDAVGVLDLPGFSRYKLQGEGARDWLNGLATGNIPRVGRLGLSYFCDEKGRVVTEMSVMAIHDDMFFLTTAASAEWHDLEWLQQKLPENSSITVENITDAFHCLIVTGPKSRDLFTGICEADLSLPWLSHQSVQIADKWCQLVRVSFAGELGWEVHTQIEDTAAIYDAIMQAGVPLGAKPFGMYALNSLRLEKSYRAWKGDLSTDYTLLQGGMDRFINWEKGDFVGRSALEAEKAKGVSKRFVTLLVDAKDCDAPYMSTLWHDGMLQSDLTTPGTELEIEIYGERIPAVVQEDQPLWDPKNERVRA